MQGEDAAGFSVRDAAFGQAGIDKLVPDSRHFDVIEAEVAKVFPRYRVASGKRFVDGASLVGQSGRRRGRFGGFGARLRHG